MFEQEEDGICLEVLPPIGEMDDQALWRPDVAQDSSMRCAAHRSKRQLVTRVLGPRNTSAIKTSPFESGSDPVGTARERFSVKFYMVGMLFILFDVEAVFMMPWAVIYRKLPAITGQRLFGFWEMVVYLGFVAVGLYYIVRKGILNWSMDKADL